MKKSSVLDQKNDATLNASRNLNTPSRTNWLDILLLAFASMLCCVQIVQPLLTDQAIYARGGEVLLSGGRLYTDFVDVKPPLIYELYSACIATFGASALALRTMEVCMHLTGLFVLWTLLRRHAQSRLITHAGCLAYAMYVASLWVPVTLQPETLAFLPLLLLIALGVKHDKTNVEPLPALFIGLVSGSLFMLKYTFVLAALPIAWSIIKHTTARAKVITYVIMGFLTVIWLSFGLVWYDGIIPALQQTAKFLAGYGATNSSVQSLLTASLETIGDFFGNNSSLLFTALALIGLVAGMMRKSFGRTSDVRTGVAQTDDLHADLSGGDRNDALFRTTVAVAVALAFSIAVERKFNLIHMSRLIPPLAILVGYGAPVLWNAMKGAWLQRSVAKPLLLAVGCLILLLSPLPRVYRSVVGLATGVVRRIETGAEPQPFLDGFVPNAGMDSVLTAVKAENPRSVVVLGMGAAILYWYLPDVTKSKFAQAHFFSAKYAPEVWQREALVEAEAADVLVLQNEDSLPLLVGHAETTQQVLFARQDWKALFDRRLKVFDDGIMSVWSRR